MDQLTLKTQTVQKDFHRRFTANKKKVFYKTLINLKCIGFSSHFTLILSIPTLRLKFQTSPIPQKYT